MKQIIQTKDQRPKYSLYLERTKYKHRAPFSHFYEYFNLHIK